MTDLWLITYLILWSFVLFLAIIIVGLARQLALLHTRLGSRGAVLDREPYGLPKGVSAPKFENLDTRDGSRIRLEQFRGRDLVLVFVRPNCPPCDVLINELVQAEFATVQDTLIVHSPDTVNPLVQKTPPPTTAPRIFPVADRDGAIAREFAIEFVPFVYLVDGDGRVAARGIANSVEQLQVLLDVQRPLESLAHHGERSRAHDDLADHAKAPL